MRQYKRGIEKRIFDTELSLYFEEQGEDVKEHIISLQEPCENCSVYDESDFPEDDFHLEIIEEHNLLESIFGIPYEDDFDVDY